MSQDSNYVDKSHNATLLLYHIVVSTKYRRVVVNEEVEKVRVGICDGIELRYDIRFLEIDSDKDHVHFLVPSVPRYSVIKVVRIIKNLISREIFSQCPEVKKELLGGEFWGKGYFTNTVGHHETKANAPKQNYI